MIQFTKTAKLIYEQKACDDIGQNIAGEYHGNGKDNPKRKALNIPAGISKPGIDIKDQHTDQQDRDWGSVIIFTIGFKFLFPIDQFRFEMRDGRQPENKKITDQPEGQMQKIFSGRWIHVTGVLQK